jgi:N-acetylglucosaminylphosphatidylinositol deacetylase
VRHPVIKFITSVTSCSRQLQDNIKQRWDAEVIAEVLRPFVIEHHITSVRNQIQLHVCNVHTNPFPSLQILTFDEKGISLHPNHFSLLGGALHLVKSLSSSADTPVPRLFGLVTMTLLSKYTGMPSVLFARVGVVARALLSRGPTADPSPIFISGIPDYLTTVRAILAHGSQMVWFRYLYMIFSRCMWINEWVEFK